MKFEEAKNILVGDKVIVAGGQFVTKDGYVKGGNVLTVVKAGEVEKELKSSYWITNEKVSIKCVQAHPRHFTKVEDQFFAGLSGFEVTSEVSARAEPATIPKSMVTGAIMEPELGVYRPNLEDRKVGKVGMHMVIDGFPNALKEIAKVMSWAADVKGYKLHDWKNLPNAATDFPAAEYRHLIESVIQKTAGVEPLKRTDHESNLMHAAHKVFNGLAELELILTGKIK